MSELLKPLRVLLSDWQEADVAMFHLATVLGIVEKTNIPFGGKKHLFWSNNPVGNLLFDQLKQLVEVGILEFDDEDQRFRWNSADDKQVL